MTVPKEHRFCNADINKYCCKCKGEGKGKDVRISAMTCGTGGTVPLILTLGSNELKRDYAYGPGYPFNWRVGGPHFGPNGNRTILRTSSPQLIWQTLCHHSTTSHH